MRTRVERHLDTYDNDNEAKRDLPNLYVSVIVIMLYIAPNTKPDISFSVHWCSWFTHNTKESHETVLDIICFIYKVPSKTV